ncbi:MAG: hypothetical protein QOH21_1933 [Acidobacteriota bacterium]|jgi:hypothetical protein|nr:hypothetical protein [Acidobacteriota bacterium]
MKRRPVRIHIQELVLHGIDPRERHAIGDAVQAELRAALAAQRLDPREGRAIERVDGGTVRVRPRTHMRGLGAQIAGALRGALRR